MLKVNSTLRVVLFLTTVFAAMCIAWFAYANPLEISNSNQTATTSVSYMTPGTATTTYYYDSYVGGSSNYAADKATMLLQFTSSSTASVLKWGYEFSQGVNGVDCTTAPTSCDWYKDDMQLPVTATSTGVYSMTAPIEYAWTFASTTQGYVAPVSSSTAPLVNNFNRALKSITVPTPTRYTRVVFTITGANGGVWATFAEQKQSPQYS